MHLLAPCAGSVSDSLVTWLVQEALPLPVEAQGYEHFYPASPFQKPSLEAGRQQWPLAYLEVCSRISSHLTEVPMPQQQVGEGCGQGSTPFTWGGGWQMHHCSRHKRRRVHHLSPHKDHEKEGVYYMYIPPRHQVTRSSSRHFLIPSRSYLKHVCTSCLLKQREPFLTLL